MDHNLPMEASHDEVVLDETATPDASLELVAYTAKRTVWVGIRSKGSSTNAAIGLHTGSEEHYVEATVSMRSSWGVAFGAVSPEIEQVEVHNERGEVFPGRIIPLPQSFREEYRGAWGVADCERECRLVGRDDRGRSIEGAMVRPKRTDLSAEESLELIRKHCDSGLRYYTWALKRMPSIPEQADHVPLVESHRAMLANVLAYVEGADSERTAVSAREEIIRRYVAAVEDEGWEPPLRSGPDLGSPAPI